MFHLHLRNWGLGGTRQPIAEVFVINEVNMENGDQVAPVLTDRVDVHMDTDWDIQKRADYIEERGPRQAVYSSRKTKETYEDYSENK